MNKYRLKPRCYYCDCDLTDIFRIFDEYVLYMCSNCGLVSTVVPKGYDVKKTNQRYYDKTYISNYLSRKMILVKRFAERIAEIEKIKLGGRILDVGCGVGLFLETLLKKSKYKWDVYGIDINKKLVETARERLGGKIYCNNLNRKIFNKDFFDCVTCFDVLEHDINLKRNLRFLNKILKKDGLLVIQSPNYRSAMAGLTGKEWDWWSVPDHLLHFTPGFLSEALKENGFRIYKISTWEPREDFVLNIKGVIRRHATQSLVLNKVLSKLSNVPLSLLWFVLKVLKRKTNIGGLVLVYAIRL